MPEGSWWFFEPPVLWLRYVDDVLVLSSKSTTDLQLLLEHLNSVRDSIRFTAEFESDGRLPFLDIDIRKCREGMIFSVYRKPTDTGAYLSRDSCHPRSVFKGLVACLKKRAVEVCSPQEVNSELRRLKGLLRLNDYSSK